MRPYKGLMSLFSLDYGAPYGSREKLSARTWAWTVFILTLNWAVKSGRYKLLNFVRKRFWATFIYKQVPLSHEKYQPHGNCL